MIRLGTTAVAATVAFLYLALPVNADFGDFRSDEPAGRPSPEESPRVNTPNDPGFDRCEQDDEDTPERECSSYFANEQFGAFGFRPDTAVLAPGVPLLYADCTQLDGRGRAANRAAGDPQCSQISGVRADIAWKYSTGDPRVVIAILDTGIRWQASELVEKIHLNRAELPRPRHDRGRPLAAGQRCGAYDREDDANDDGAFNVLDFACDSRVELAGGDTESDELLDGSDLIAAFSEGNDSDRNGYVDDIAGWDYFDDDNDPFDASSCCNSAWHGTGRAEEAAAAGDNGADELGLCPDCQVMPLRVWDTFVLDTNRFALATIYAADNGADVVAGAVGGLLNSAFARRAFSYADRRGVALTMVLSDTNSANHNYPTNYNEAISVAGALPDTAPVEDCDLPDVPGAPDRPEELDFFSDQCQDFFRELRGATGGPLPPPTQPPTTSFFRNSNLTQYGGKADVVLMGLTGSINTGQAAGAAGLLQAYGRDRFAGSRLPKRLSGNEIRQLLTMTAEDVLPENTGTNGQPDKANPGWDPHFGYGRVNLAGAMRRIARGRIPPEAQIDAPDWFAPINVDKLPRGGVRISGRAAAPHSRRGVGRWELEYACGQDALDRAFRPVPGARGSGPEEGVLGRLSPGLLRGLADGCDGSIQDDAGLPAGRPSNPFPADPYPSPDPHRHAFQIRFTVHEAGDRANLGRYRKTLHAYRDDGTSAGWPRPIGERSSPRRLVTGSGGEVAPRLANLDEGDDLEIVLADSSGRLSVLDERGRPLPSFNRRQPLSTRRYALVGGRNRPSSSLGGFPREPFRTPAIGDITGDGDPEIVASAGEHVYAWHHDGRRVREFPVRIDRGLSEPCKRGRRAKPCFNAERRAITPENHIKRGFIGSVALADLDDDRRLDIVVGSLDQHVYAWDGRGRRLRARDADGRYPVKLSTPGTIGAEIITSPAIAELDGDDDPEVVLATNEILEPASEPPDTPEGIPDSLAQGATGSSLIYAIHADGRPVDGWPVKVGVLRGDVLPLVFPGNDAAALDADGDPDDDEVAVSAATGAAKVVDGDGSTIAVLSNAVTPSANVTDASLQGNTADYPSVGDLGTRSPSVIKGGISLMGAANLLAANQNFPFNHTLQAWNPRSGDYLPGFPVATDDFMLLSQPAVAKVDRAGTGRQALTGTGLYQLHAYGRTGTEPPGWPKFLGGWVQPTPAVGDLDADDRLEVTAVTREGWAFVWDTPAPTCQSGRTTTNGEWWTWHHDEHGTANYRADSRAPSRPGELRIRRVRGRVVRLSFRGSGDDVRCGEASRYEVRGSDRPIRTGAHFRDAREPELLGPKRPTGAPRDALAVRRPSRFRFLAIRARDDAGNVSFVRSARLRARR